MSTLLIACGGTGGHVAPGIALAQELSERGHRCILILSRKEVDARLMQRYPQLEYVQAPGVGLGKGLRKVFAFSWQQLRSVFFNIQLIRRYNPEACIAFGGFITLGVLIASKLLKVPCALHESNQHPGKAIRWLHRLADQLYLPAPEVLKFLKNARPERIRYSPYPVRKDLVFKNKEDACVELGLDPKKPVLVVLGGSQGAQALNQWARSHARTLAQHGIQLYCVTGTQHQPQAECLWHPSPSGQPVAAHFVPFTDTMASVVCSADLVISRSGAGAIAEICHFHVPAIYVPFPFAADKHQHANAAAVVAQDLAWMLLEKDLHHLIPQVLKLFASAKILENVRQRLREKSSTQALHPFADDLQAWAFGIQIGMPPAAGGNNPQTP